MPSLVVLGGKSAGTVFELADGAEWEVGTARKAFVHLRDRGVSYQHAKLVRRGGAIVLVDGGSPGGTAVNRQRVSGERELTPGDVIAVGEIEMRFEEKHAAPAPAVVAPTIAAPPAPEPA